jgi:hypothetical protein
VRVAQLLFCLGLLLLAAPASADPDAARAWATTARTTYGIMGPHKRPTGGMIIQADTTRSWALSEGLHVLVGAELALEGFDSGGRWMAVLGGLTGQIRGRTLWHPLWFGAGLHVDAGRLPTCSSWGFCMQSAGIFPALSQTVSYAPSDRVRFDLRMSERWIRTLPWDGAGIEVGFAGTILL